MKKSLSTLSLLLCIFTLSAQNALNFDGIDDYIQTSYTGVTGSADRTFEAWIYWTPSASPDNMTILDYGLNAAGSRNTFSVDSGGLIRFISGGTSNANLTSPANSIMPNQWTHVAFVLNNGMGIFYINGAQAINGSLSAVSTPSNGQSVRIGERVAGGSKPFTGNIDEVRIWNVARTAGQIQSNMNNELCSTDPNLQLYLQFNQGMAGGNNVGLTSATDISGNNYTGILNNFGLTAATSNWILGTQLGSGVSYNTIQQTACDSFSLSANSTTYTSTGIYTETLTNANNCDSIITLDLTINNSTTGTDVITSCSSINWIDGNTYTTSNNTATHIIPNSSGCDSLVTLDLTIGGLNSTVTQNGTTLTANQAGVTYQWVECPNFIAVSGATNQSFTALTNGSYAVIIDDGLCTDTSECVLVNSVGIWENDFAQEVKIYPNPMQSEFTVDLGQIYQNAEVNIMDLHGKMLFSQKYSSSQLVDVQLNASPGVYILTIVAEDKQARIRIVKQ